MSNVPQCKEDGCKNKVTYTLDFGEVTGKPVRRYKPYCQMHTIKNAGK